MFDLASFPSYVIKVIGIGCGGCKVLEYIINTNQLPSSDHIKIEFFAVHTDKSTLDSLNKSSAYCKIEIGANITKGLGACGNPNIGRPAAEDDREILSNMISGADMVVIVATMGGGTATGAAPVIAEIAKEQGALTVGIVTKPFAFEGKKRSQYAEQGIRECSEYIDSLITVPYDRFLNLLPKNVKFNEAFGIANDVLSKAVLGITDIITSESFVNEDFADVKKVMSEMGIIGIGIAEGENRAENAVKEAVSNPLLEDVDLSSVKDILVNIASGYDIEFAEVDTIMEYVASLADPDATIIVGSTLYTEMEGQIRVTLVPKI